MRASRPRSVLVLSINYTPELTGFAPHVAVLAEFLAQQGYETTVVTGFPFAPQWKRWVEYRGKFWTVGQMQGVCVVRISHYIPRKARRMWERLLMEATFCFSAVLALLRYRPSFDAVVYVGAQPSIAMLARLIATFRRVSYGVMINDLASGAASDVGIVKSRLLQSLLWRFEVFSYAGAKRALVLCNSFEDILRKSGYSAPIHVIRSPVDLDNIHFLETDQEMRRTFGLSPTDKVVLFAGSMGLKQGLVNVVAAAEVLSNRRSDVHWLLVGDGETRKEIEALVVAKEAGKYIHFAPFQPQEILARLFSIADILLLNQLKAVKDTVIPSKLLSYMAAGRAVIAAVNDTSQGADILRESKGGTIVPPEDAKLLADTVAQMIDKPLDLAQMGRSNRSYAEIHFDQRVILRQQEEFVRYLFKSGAFCL